MKRQKYRGQHFLNSEILAQKIVSEAGITKQDTVFELGTGHGILTVLLCRVAGKVISVDVDEGLVEDARSRLAGCKNLVLRAGDGFRMQDPFDIFVSNLPYSKSRDAIEWLAQAKFSHGVIMVQNEFAKKIRESSRATSVIANYCFEISTISSAGRNNFTPRPRVDSTVLKIVRKNTLDRHTIKAINRMFSYKRKMVKNIQRQFGIDSQDEGRIDQLSAAEVVGIARSIK